MAVPSGGVRAVAPDRPPRLRSVRPALPRDRRAASYAETFLIAAGATVLLVRGFLALTGYPQVGGGGLHIAHLLWGGLLMLAGLLLLLSYLGEAPKRTTAWLSGVGFGLFIDELGKFITEDNDYFYRPAIALIYVVFVLLVLALRAVHGRRPLSQTEHLLNALALMDRVATGRLDDGARRALLRHLAAADQAQPLVAHLRRAVQEAPLVGPSDGGWLDRPRRLADRAYRRLTGWRGFAGAVAAVFVAQAVAMLAVAAEFVVSDLGHLVEDAAGLSFVEAGSLAASLASGAFVVLGVLRLPRSRLAAFRSFDRALLISVFVGQFFAFAQHPPRALGGLAVTVLLLGAVRFVTAEEEGRLNRGGAPTGA